MPNERKITGALLVGAILATVGAVLVAGCSSAQLQADEAVVHAGLLRLEQGIDWARANPAVVSAALDEAAKLDPNSAHLQAAVAKGKAAVAVGDLDTARGLVHAAAVLSTPVPAAPR